MAATRKLLVSEQHVRGATAAQLATLSVRVDGLGEDIHNINSAIRSLSAKFDQFTAPKEPKVSTWIAGAALALTLFGGFYVTAVNPVTNNIARIEAEDRDYRKTTARILEKISDSIVPRNEHDQHWRAYDDRINAISVRINEVNKALADINSPKDAMQDMRERLKALDERLTDIIKMQKDK